MHNHILAEELEVAGYPIDTTWGLNCNTAGICRMRFMPSVVLDAVAIAVIEQVIVNHVYVDVAARRSTRKAAAKIDPTTASTDDGDYTCEVSDGTNTLTSNGCTLTVI